GDNIDDIVAAIRQLTETHDILITTGGLGPTDDDLTAEALAIAGNTE
ncbi:MAG: damage-inducible protein CinA, partial [Desulfuromonadales bacterium]|nr:damage-inducible protein CinA [Desulfuromonadales bacterium]